MSYKDYNCRMVYYTSAGRRKTAHLKTRATIDHDAMTIAERLLRSDKRRNVGIITHIQAIQQ